MSRLWSGRACSAFRCQSINRHLAWTPGITRKHIDRIQPASLNRIHTATLNGDSSETDLESSPIAQRDGQEGNSEAQQPWYLRAQTPVSQQNPLLDRQALPDLPPHSPALLGEFLQYISQELGLDDLSILDLRDIDPPPALGPNLLMILATARSEKHLHISADRFRRWTKTAHGKNAFTDGLIGRGELKLKLRRKMRRAKLLSRVGAAETTPLDDGIRTGWICVTVRDLEGASGSEIRQDLQDDYVGFGVEKPKTNVIIQMLTQAKRDDLDLDLLWTQDQNRSGHGNFSKGVHLHAKDSFLDHGWAPSTDLGSSSISRTASRPPLGQHWGQQHFHHSSRGLHHTPQNRRIADAFVLRPQTRRFSVSHRRGQISGSLHQWTILDLKSLTHSTRYLSSLSKRPMSTTVDQFDISLIDPDRLGGMPHAETQALLSSRSPIWKILQKNEPLFPSFEYYTKRLQLHVFAVQVGLSEHKREVQAVIQRMQSNFVNLPHAQVWDVVIQLLQEPVKDSDFVRVSALLQSGIARGHQTSLQELRLDLLDAILVKVADQESLTTSQHAYHRMRRLLNQHSPYAALRDDVRSLHQCAHVGRWDEVWRIWREYPMTMRRRPTDLYCAMLECAALRKHQAKAIDILRECVAEMEIEDPPIELDADLACAFKACILVAEPNASYEANDKSSNAEWASLWRRCDEATNNHRLELE